MDLVIFGRRFPRGCPASQHLRPLRNIDTNDTEVVITSGLVKDMTKLAGTLGTGVSFDAAWKCHPYPWVSTVLGIGSSYRQSILSWVIPCAIGRCGPTAIGQAGSVSMPIGLHTLHSCAMSAFIQFARDDLFPDCYSFHI